MYLQHQGRHNSLIQAAMRAKNSSHSHQVRHHLHQMIPMMTMLRIIVHLNYLHNRLNALIESPLEIFEAMDEEKDEADDEDTVVNAMATPRAPVPTGPAATPVEQLEQDPVEITGPAAMPAAAVPTVQLDQHDVELIATNPPQDEAGRGPLSSPRLRSAVARLGQVAASVVSPRNILDSVVDAITPRTSTSMQSTRRVSKRHSKGKYDHEASGIEALWGYDWNNLRSQRCS